MQKTILNPVYFEGIGLHSGQALKMTVLPAEVDFGIRFYRTDISGQQNEIVARYDQVSDTRLNTRISNHANPELNISTIEHIMAAFAGLGVTNARVEVNGAEIPVLDGSSQLYVQEFWRVGLREQEKASRVYKVIRPVRVEGTNGAFAELLPSDSFSLDLSIDFSDPAIGQQALKLNLANGVFVRELADCRTFTRFFEVKTLQENGLALGGSLDNAVVVDDGKVLNPEGFRRPDECVRHKMLDALGDLYLAGGSILGTYRGHLSGHALTNQVLRKAFATGALIEVSSKDAMSFQPALPGYALEPSDFAVA